VPDAVAPPTFDVGFMNAFLTALIQSEQKSLALDWFSQFVSATGWQYPEFEGYQFATLISHCITNGHLDLANQIFSTWMSKSVAKAHQTGGLSTDDGLRLRHTDLNLIIDSNLVPAVRGTLPLEEGNRRLDFVLGLVRRAKDLDDLFVPNLYGYGLSHGVHKRIVSALTALVTRSFFCRPEHVDLIWCVCARLRVSDMADSTKPPTAFSNCSVIW
jgi:hypothetical protein